MGEPVVLNERGERIDIDLTLAILILERGRSLADALLDGRPVLIDVTAGGDPARLDRADEPPLWLRPPPVQPSRALMYARSSSANTTSHAIETNIIRISSTIAAL